MNRRHVVLGDALDIKEYHNAVLKDGGLLLYFLEPVVEEYIEGIETSPT
jgi:uncharacterized protein (DUF885 family)